jgi:hypothetical protein
VRKGSLSPQLGFPARSEEIRRFGDSARRIWRVLERRCDHRTFAQVVMKRRPPPGRPDWQANKRKAMESGDGGGDWGRQAGGDWGKQAGGSWAHREEEELRKQLLAKGNQVVGDPRRPGRPGQERRDWGDRGAGGSKPAMKCFKCGREGHHQASCTNPPLCYSCHSSGHISANFPMLQSKRGVKLCGFGIPGQGFYSLQVDVSDVEMAKHPVRGILTVLQGVASVEMIRMRESF